MYQALETFETNVDAPIEGLLTAHLGGFLGDVGNIDRPCRPNPEALKTIISKKQNHRAKRSSNPEEQAHFVERLDTNSSLFITT